MVRDRLIRPGGREPTGRLKGGDWVKKDERFAAEAGASEAAWPSDVEDTGGSCGAGVAAKVAGGFGGVGAG